MDNESIAELVYAPLEKLALASNKMAQMGAAHCLYTLFLYLQKRGNRELLEQLVSKYLLLFAVRKVVMK